MQQMTAWSEPDRNGGREVIRQIFTSNKERCGIDDPRLNGIQQWLSSRIGTLRSEINDREFELGVLRDLQRTVVLVRDDNLKVPATIEVDPSEIPPMPVK